MKKGLSSELWAFGNLGCNTLHLASLDDGRCLPLVQDFHSQAPDARSQGKQLAADPLRST